MLRIPSTSKEYLTVPITGLEGGETAEIAVVAPTVEEPASGDWKPATLVGSDAKILLGPGTALPLPNGVYRIWVRITSDPEIPVLRSGLLRIT